MTGSQHLFNKIDNPKICRELLALYSQIPDRDVHLMAERYRDLLYHHAHAAVVYVFRLVRDLEMVLDEMEDFFHSVALQFSVIDISEGTKKS